MSGFEIKDLSHLVDPATGEVVGVKGANGQEYLTNARTLTLLDVRSYGVIPDGVQLSGVNLTSNSTSVQPITIPGANFTQDDVGKLAVLISSAQDMGNPVRPATITSVQSASTCTVTYSTGYMSSFTGGTMIYGTNNFDALQTAFNAAAESATRPAGTVFLPRGIMLARKSGFGLVIPDRVSVIGTGNTHVNVGHMTLKWSGTTIVPLSGHPDNSAGLSVGYPAGGNTDALHKGGSILRDFNVDGCGVLNTVLRSENWSTKINHVTIARGNFITLSIGGSCMVRDCCVVTGAMGTPVKMNPADCTFDDSVVIGGGLNLPSIECDGANSSISGNHLFRTQSVAGDGIFINMFNTGQGSFVIANNRFDSLQGDAITIKVSGTTRSLEGATIIGNVGFTNDVVTTNTHSFIKFDIATGCSVRGLSIIGNSLQSSFTNPSLGLWKNFIDGVGIVGNAYGVTVVGNICNGCNASYASFTPAYTAGNILMGGTGATVTVF